MTRMVADARAQGIVLSFWKKERQVGQVKVVVWHIGVVRVAN